MQKSIIIVLFLIANLSFAQTINDFQYAIIPARCSFLKENNEYRINATTKAFFQQKGFITYYDNEILPDVIATNKCKAVFVDIQENNTMFLTKIKVVIKDCKNNILLASQEGSTREKDLQRAYSDALIFALKSIQNINYKYNEKSENVASVEKTTGVETSVSGTSQIYSEMQTITNGFNFLNKETKAVLTLFKTSEPTSYIARFNDKNGIVFQKNDNWFFEYYLNNKLVSEKIELKF
jgi:hypothetical protein